MRLLLDTHAFIWWDSEPGKLSAHALALCQNTEHELILSVVSVWEMQIKLQIGKLRLNRPLAELISEQQELNQVTILSVNLSHVLVVGSLPPLHKDPFDRLLIAQAKVEALSIITHDAQFARYPVPLEW